jgi:hypothetical protein
MTPKKPTAVSKCFIETRKLPLDSYRLTTDSNKWKMVARSRQSMLNFLAGFANPDGTFRRNDTNYSPSRKTIIDHFEFSHVWVDKIQDDLHKLGRLSWTRKNRQERREYTISIPEGNCSPIPEGKQSPILPIPEGNPTPLRVTNLIPEGKQSHPEIITKHVESAASEEKHFCPSLPLLKEPTKDNRTTQSPSAPTHSPSLKPTAADKERAKEFVKEIKTVSMQVSDDKAVFYGKHTKALEVIMLDFIMAATLDHDFILATVRERVLDMNGNSFRLNQCGNELVECLGAILDSKQRTRVQQKQQDDAVEYSQRMGREQADRERDERLARIAEENTLAENCNPFGDPQIEELNHELQA